MDLLFLVYVPVLYSQLWTEENWSTIEGQKSMLMGTVDYLEVFGWKHVFAKREEKLKL